MGNHSLVRLGSLVVEKYLRDDCTSLAATLAYFALFSFFPLILVSLSLVGFFVDPNAFEVRRQLLALIGSPEIRELVTQTLEHFSENRVNAGLVGFGTLFFAAAGVFGALDRAFDIIWEVERPAGASWGAAVRSLVVARLIAFALVLGLAGLVLAAVTANVFLTLLSEQARWLPQQELLWSVVRPAVTLLLISVAMAAIFKILPGGQATWGDVLPAALVTAVLLALLQALAGFVFARINFSSYGAVGGAMTLLLWIYLCCQVILVGGEISYAWARVLGSLRAPPGQEPPPPPAPVA